MHPVQRQTQKSPAFLSRTKSVYAQRNLKTIKEAKKEKAKDAEASGAAVILRILRMRFVLPFFLFPYC